LSRLKFWKFWQSSRSKSGKRSLQTVEAGFTLVELLVVIILTSVVFVTFSSFINNYLVLYSKYQKDSSNFTELASQSQRIAQVLRGLTDIVSESGNDLTAYAYFSPIDTYVSQVHYYLNSAGTALMVDVTPMTSNPPTGTLITANKKTYIILTNYYQVPGGSLFAYYDASGSLLSIPIADEHTIQSIQINLAEPGSHTTQGQQLNITVSLRNRKTNL
jgi:prepilin-type N-terminal cleavage/methylation domain-containing protein